MERMWNRIEFRDKGTGCLKGVEILPVNDIDRHESCPNCRCMPIYEEEQGIKYLVHHAFDGRDVDEKKEKGH